MIEHAIQEAVTGMFLGFIIGAIEAYSKKLLFGVIFVGAVLTLAAYSITDTASVAEPFTPLWGYVVFLVFFVGGVAVGKGMYREAME